MSAVDETYAAIMRAAEWEVAVRQWARWVELDRDRAEEAADLFRVADGLRRIRLALLDRLGLRVF